MFTLAWLGWGENVVVTVSAVAIVIVIVIAGVASRFKV
jgi:cellulase/cellobiase CelA1